MWEEGEAIRKWKKSWQGSLRPSCRWTQDIYLPQFPFLGLPSVLPYQGAKCSLSNPGQTPRVESLWRKERVALRRQTAALSRPGRIPSGLALHFLAFLYSVLPLLDIPYLPLMVAKRSPAAPCLTPISVAIPRRVSFFLRIWQKSPNWLTDPSLNWSLEAGDRIHWQASFRLCARLRARVGSITPTPNELS